MQKSVHPDMPYEKRHLTATLNIVASELFTATSEEGDRLKELNVARRFDPDNLPLREMLYSAITAHIHGLSLAMKRPFFTRIDFTETGGAPETHYIGKYGVMQSGTLATQIVDWRSPIANLYYSGQIGPMHYETPDGKVDGELTLKRQFNIRDGELISLFDADVVSQDEFLHDVLSNITGERLREVVTTIQAEQNFVIRYPLRRPLLVQGVAGSGKTTIALHRIAYLLYTHGSEIHPEQMVILAPNPLFLTYISGVLPDLGVDKVVQSTFAAFIGGIFGGLLPKVHEEHRLRQLMDMPPDAREARTAKLKEKGSLGTLSALQTFVDGWISRYIPEDALNFGPYELFKQGGLRRAFLQDLSPYAVDRRVKELKKIITSRIKPAMAAVETLYMQECDKRVDAIKAKMADSPERRVRLIKLYDSRDVRIKEAKARVKPFAAEVLKKLPAFFAWGVLQEFYKAQDIIQESPEREDIAALALVALKLFEIKKPDVRHMIIDEAQDMSPMDFYALRAIIGTDSITAVGDLMQGIHAYRGIADWSQLTDGVFRGDVTRHDLITSYRNTIEIMNAAIDVARHRPVPGQREAHPVLRHGDAPTCTICSTQKAANGVICAHVEDWLSQGHKTIALIARDEAAAKALKKALPAQYNAKLLDIADEKYDGGIMVAAAADVKGLEFDAVCLTDASSENYPNDDLHTRLIYIAFTRALHRLAVVAVGALAEVVKQF